MQKTFFLLLFIITIIIAGCQNQDNRPNPAAKEEKASAQAGVALTIKNPPQTQDQNQ